MSFVLMTAIGLQKLSIPFEIKKVMHYFHFHLRFDYVLYHKSDLKPHKNISQ